MIDDNTYHTATICEFRTGRTIAADVPCSDELLRYANDQERGCYAYRDEGGVWWPVEREEDPTGQHVLVQADE